MKAFWEKRKNDFTLSLLIFIIGIAICIESPWNSVVKLLILIITSAIIVFSTVLLLLGRNELCRGILLGLCSYLIAVGIYIYLHNMGVYLPEYYLGLFFVMVFVLQILGYFIPTWTQKKKVKTRNTAVVSVSGGFLVSYSLIYVRLLENGVMSLNVKRTVSILILVLIVLIFSIMSSIYIYASYHGDKIILQGDNVKVKYSENSEE